MRRLLLVATTATLTLFTGLSVSLAQDGVPQFRPVEMWACTFNERKDQDDMDKVYEMYTGNSDAAYSAWQLNPYFVGTLIQQFDFLYLGAWADNTAMGADLADDFAGSGAVEEAWNEVATCGGLMFASLQIQGLPEGGGGGDGPFIMTIQDCKVGHGVSNRNAVNAISQFNDYRVANGMSIPTFAWFQTAGDGNAEFDFKLAHAYADAAAWGNAGQWIMENQAYLVRGQMTDGIVDCDEARVYTGRTLMDNMN